MSETRLRNLFIFGTLFFLLMLFLPGIVLYLIDMAKTSSVQMAEEPVQLAEASTD